MPKTKGIARPHITKTLNFHTEIKAVSALGPLVRASNGKTYLDFAGGLATVSTGHCHPKVVAAIKKQAGKLIHSGCIFLYDSILTLSKKLSEITPQGIDTFFFSNSGAEAVEGAIKLAKYSTGRQGVIGFIGGFHGRTYGAATLTTSNVKYRRKYHPFVPSIYHAPYPYCFRCLLGKNNATCSIECITYLERMFEHVIAPEETACVVIEPVLGEGGYAIPPLKYLKRLREICDKHGILLIADEVQSGIGRTGKWFAIEHYGIKPDIMAIAKGIASGMPISAVGASRKLMDKWPVGAHGTTFGGNPVSAAAAIATIDVIKKDKLVQNAAELGQIALKRLKELKQSCRAIGDVRGLGLMIGVELVKPDNSPNHELTAKTVKEAERKGLLIVECGVNKNVIRFMPPLNISRKDLDKALNIFEASLRASL